MTPDEELKVPLVLLLVSCQSCLGKAQLVFIEGEILSEPQLANIYVPLPTLHQL